uniref:Protein cramped-like n=1 Tax=Eptatretus burgeri TaxID=7764 RepID=A0A8C4NA01_EPTBU
MTVQAEDSIDRMPKKTSKKVPTDSCNSNGEAFAAALQPEPMLPASPPNRAGPLPVDAQRLLRSSVRPPIKRARSDSSSTPGKGRGTIAGSVDAAGVTSGCGTNTNAGAARREQGSVGTPSDSTEVEKTEGPQKKVRRQWESWSTEDKNSFFEGLNEHGKDFEAIQNSFAQRYRKKGRPANMVKNKEQVRHFYYRTWHKICKYIDFDSVFSQDLKKSSQELYGLICYGELRKKIGGCELAAKVCLLSCISVTTVRYKGRNLRIKMPTCRSLKKICDPYGASDDEDQKPAKLPPKVCLELLPKTNKAWAHVQNTAHNPRLRMIVELHRKVASLIAFLQEKWSPRSARLRTSEDVRPSARDVQYSELRLYPPKEAVVTLLAGVARVVHTKALCTVHWHQEGRTSTNFCPTPPWPSGIPSTSVDSPLPVPPRWNTDDNSVSDAVMHSLQSGRNVSNPADSDDCEGLTSEGTVTSPGEQCPKIKDYSNCGPTTSLEAQGETWTNEDDTQNARVIAGLAECGDKQEVVAKKVSGESGVEVSEDAGETGRGTGFPPKKSKEEAAIAFANHLREEGWGAATGPLTIAEVYLMLGKPSKLQLDYDWPELGGPSMTRVNGQCTETLSSTPLLPLNTTCTAEAWDPTLRTGLKQLLQLAILQVNAAPVSTLAGLGVTCCRRSVIIRRSRRVPLVTLALRDTSELGATANELGEEGESDEMPSESCCIAPSPPHVSTLLDISLPATPEEGISQSGTPCHVSDAIIEIAINSSGVGQTLLSPRKMNGEDVDRSLTELPSTPWLSSPPHDPQWYSGDISLGGLICEFAKQATSTELPQCSAQASTSVSHTQVDTQLACMMSESSVDYVSRFTDLARAVSAAHSTPARDLAPAEPLPHSGELHPQPRSSL